MNLDGARNAQIEILREVFSFSEVPGSGGGPDAMIDPDFFDATEQEYTHPMVMAAAISDATLITKYSERSVKNRVTKRKQKVSDDIAIGVMAGMGSDDFRLLAIYQRPGLKHDVVFALMAEKVNREIEFVYGGRVRTSSAWHRTRIDPLQLGASVGHRDVTAGTLGCFAVDRQTQRLGILSNNHVLADVNAGKIGDDILQPARADGGVLRDKIGTLQKFVPIRFAGASNQMDGAWAELDGNRNRSPRDLIDSAGVAVTSVASTRPVTLQPLDKVIKMGRTTGYTQGEVTAVNVMNLVVNMGSGLLARFDHAVQIGSLAQNAFSKGGDSGSIILRNDGLPGALLFAASASGGNHNQGMTFANPLDLVLNTLGLDLVT